MLQLVVLCPAVLSRGILISIVPQDQDARAWTFNRLPVGDLRWFG